jgi:hypothetical protein
MNITTEEPLSIIAICDLVEKMEKNHHIEILNIISKYPSIPLNPKSNGFHFRMDMFPKEAIEEIQKYIQYVRKQETTLSQLETQKQEIKREYFSEENE